MIAFLCHPYLFEIVLTTFFPLSSSQSTFGIQNSQGLDIDVFHTTLKSLALLVSQLIGLFGVSGSAKWRWPRVIPHIGHKPRPMTDSLAVFALGVGTIKGRK